MDEQRDGNDWGNERKGCRIGPLSVAEEVT